MLSWHENEVSLFFPENESRSSLQNLTFSYQVGPF